MARDRLVIENLEPMELTAEAQLFARLADERGDKGEASLFRALAQRITELETPAFRDAVAVRSAAHAVKTLARTFRHTEAVADCPHCNLTFLADRVLDVLWPEPVRAALPGPPDPPRAMTPTSPDVERASWWLCFRCWLAFFVPTTEYFGACPDCQKPTVPWPQSLGDPRERVSMRDWATPATSRPRRRG